ncbi:ubiquinone/menaquinone biosynthesis protein [Picosynechococcus sp. PCC 7003]|nr:ubiquinone/menaquinone biosynthesis protein [Picosynechococcus sp. PCC 7003]
MKRLYLLKNSTFQKIFNFVLGVHPNNSIFSFNYHNVSHINNFLIRSKKNLERKKNTLIDIGAGASPYYYIFEEKVSRYIAVDVPDSLPKNEQRPIEQIPSFAESIPLEESICDLVLCNQALEHIQNPSKAVSEIYRILKPGGRFIGSVPHVSPVHLEPYDFRRYTDLGVKKLLEEAGFINIEVEGNGGVYSTVALIVAMDWMLTTRKEGQAQGFSASRALLLSPLVGLMNIMGIILDKILGNKGRTPANLCWIATKPNNI